MTASKYWLAKELYESEHGNLSRQVYTCRKLKLTFLAQQVNNFFKHFPIKIFSFKNHNIDLFVIL